MKIIHLFLAILCLGKAFAGTSERIEFELNRDVSRLLTRLLLSEPKLSGIELPPRAPEEGPISVCSLHYWRDEARSADNYLECRWGTESFERVRLNLFDSEVYPVRRIDKPKSATIRDPHARELFELFETTAEDFEGEPFFRKQVQDFASGDHYVGYSFIAPFTSNNGFKVDRPIFECNLWRSPSGDDFFFCIVTDERE